MHLALSEDQEDLLLTKPVAPRQMRGVPLSKAQQHAARDAASSIGIDGLNDMALMERTVTGAAKICSQSSLPAFYAEFWTTIALRQGTILNAVHHFPQT